MKESKTTLMPPNETALAFTVQELALECCNNAPAIRSMLHRLGIQPCGTKRIKIGSCVQEVNLYDESALDSLFKAYGFTS